MPLFYTLHNIHRNSGRNELLIKARRTTQGYIESIWCDKRKVSHRFTRCWIYRESLMRTIMYCCFISHNMIVRERDALIELEVEDNGVWMRTGNKTEACFARRNVSSRNYVSITINPLCVTIKYLHSSYEYMETRRVFFQTITTEINVSRS